MRKSFMLAVLSCFGILISLLLLTHSEIVEAQADPHIINLAISNVNHDNLTGNDTAFLVVKTDTNIASNLTIEYDTSPAFDSPGKRTKNSTGQMGADGKLRHEVLLDNLATSTTIYYRVKDSLGNSIANANFHTAQLVGQNFSFGVVSDLHSGSGIAGDANEGSVEWAATLNRMASENLDMALSGGDAIGVTEWTGVWQWNESLCQITQKYNALFNGTTSRPGGAKQLTSSVPLYTALGNHEAPEYQTAKTAYEQEFALPVNNGSEASNYGKEYYSFV